MLDTKCLQNLFTVMVFSEKLCSLLVSRIVLLNCYNFMGNFRCAVTAHYKSVHWLFFSSLKRWYILFLSKFITHF